MPGTSSADIAGNEAIDSPGKGPHGPMPAFGMISFFVPGAAMWSPGKRAARRPRSPRWFRAGDHSFIMQLSNVGNAAGHAPWLFLGSTRPNIPGRCDPAPGRPASSANELSSPAG